MDHNDLHDELDSWLTDGADQIIGDGDGIEPLPVEHDGNADRMLRAIARLQRDADEVHAVADAEIARIRAWAEDRTAGIPGRVAWIERSLAGFMAGRGVRTLKLPNGELTLRPARQRVEVDETEATLLALEAADPSLVTHTTKAARSKIGDLLTAGGTLYGRTEDGLHEIRSAVLVVADETTGEKIEREVTGVRILVPVGDVFKAKPTRGDVVLEAVYDDA